MLNNMYTQYQPQGRPQTIVTKFLVVESGTYGEQYRRPYETTLTGEVQEIITNRFTQTRGTVDTGTIVAGVSGSFLRPQAQPEKEIVIPYGWNQVRYRALIEVETTHQSGNKVSEVIMAWSDYCDPSLTGLLDPDMPFTINSIVVLRNYREDFGVGMQDRIGVANSSHLLSSDSFHGHSTPNRDNLTRPMDVFSYISRAAIDDGTPTKDIYDGRTVSGTTPVKSERKNAVPASYIGKVLGGYTAAYRSGAALGQTGHDMMMEAQNTVSENEASTDHFLKALREQRQAPMIDKHFTLNELIRLSPETLSPGRSILHVVPMTAPLRASMHHVGESASWATADETTRIATVLANAIPSLMMEQLFARAIIRASNRTRADGQIDVKVSEYMSFSDMDLSQNVLVLEARIALEVMMDISQCNQADFDIDMVIHLDGESRMNISFCGRPHVEYVVPSFADALLVPLITNQEQRAFDMASDFRTLGDIITDAGTQAPTMKNAVYQSGNSKLF